MSRVRRDEFFEIDSIFMSVDAADTELSRADLRRAQVLDAAVLCFGRSGFHGASMADIAAEASMSVGQIYRYFANKEAIIASIVARDMESALAVREAIRARNADPVEELVRSCGIRWPTWTATLSGRRCLWRYSPKPRAIPAWRKSSAPPMKPGVRGCGKC